MKRLGISKLMVSVMILLGNTCANESTSEEILTQRGVSKGATTTLFTLQTINSYEDYYYIMGILPYGIETKNGTIVLDDAILHGFIRYEADLNKNEATVFMVFYGCSDITCYDNFYRFRVISEDGTLGVTLPLQPFSPSQYTKKEKHPADELRDLDWKKSFVKADLMGDPDKDYHDDKHVLKQSNMALLLQPLTAFIVEVIDDF